MKNRLKAQKGTLKAVLSYIKPYRALAVISIIFSAANVALILYAPVLVGHAVDAAIGVGAVDFAAVLPPLVRLCVVAAIASCLQWVVNAVNNRIAFEVVRDVREKAFENLLSLPLGYLDSHPTGEVVSRMISDVEQFADGLLLGFSQLFTGVVTIIGTLFFMLSIQPIIAAVVVLLTPLSFFVARFIASRTSRLFREQSEVRGEQTALIEETVSGQKVVKAFAHEDEITEKFDEINDRLERCSVKATFFSSLTNPGTRFINSVVYACVALSGALLCVASPAFSVGNLTALLAYANQYTKPFNEISGVITELQNAFACASRVFALINEPRETADKPNAEVLEKANGDVRLRDVTFSYTPDRKLIRGLSLAANAGQRVAIVGPTGCGKTTLINLLMRFYDPNSGSISVDGVDITDITRESLRANYGMVLQDTWLKSGTIRDNIAMGKPDASMEEVISAARASHADDFIVKLPEGYDTVIGEEGGSLSQGQKQLLCIARVMLSLPPMLILDEATSSIDTRTEQKIQNAFAVMMKGRTSFIVAHRLSTIREADLILVMRDGDVIEQGTHEELLDKGGFYHELYQSQFAVV